MKKLNKLQINNEKVMKNDELLALRGGYGLNGYCCWCFGGSYPGAVLNVESEEECKISCIGGGEGTWYC